MELIVYRSELKMKVRVIGISLNPLFKGGGRFFKMLGLKKSMASK